MDCGVHIHKTSPRFSVTFRVTSWYSFFHFRMSLVVKVKLERWNWIQCSQKWGDMVFPVNWNSILCFFVSKKGFFAKPISNENSFKLTHTHAEESFSELFRPNISRKLKINFIFIYGHTKSYIYQRGGLHHHPIYEKSFLLEIIPA